MNMHAIHIQPITQNLIVRYSGKKVSLPKDIQIKIDTYWDFLIKTGKTYTRGEAFTITNKRISKNLIDILVEKTDYAHYVYCQDQGMLRKNAIQIIHTSILISTLDNKTLFGKMGNHTSRAGTYQLCGGGIDNDDLRGDVFDLKHNITKELFEELGIDAHDTNRVGNLRLAYFKQGGSTDNLAVIFHIDLLETSTEFLRAYEKFKISLKKKGELPEFDEITILEKNPITINQFFDINHMNCDEYMQPLFQYLAKNNL